MWRRLSFLADRFRAFGGTVRANHRGCELARPLFAGLPSERSCVMTQQAARWDDCRAALDLFLLPETGQGEAGVLVSAPTRKRSGRRGHELGIVRVGGEPSDRCSAAAQKKVFFSRGSEKRGSKLTSLPPAPSSCVISGDAETRATTRVASSDSSRW